MHIDDVRYGHFSKNNFYEYTSEQWCMRIDDVRYFTVLSWK